MKKIVIFSLFLLFFSFVYAEKLIIVSVKNPDENSVDNKDYLLIKECFEKMKIDVKFEYYPWQRCIELIENKKADAIFSLKKTPERESFLLYPDEEIRNSEWFFFYKKGKNIVYNSLNDLKGYRIAATTGYAYGDEFWKNRDIIIDEGYDDIVNMKKIDNDRVDFFLCNKEDGEKIINALKIADIIKTEKYYSKYPLYLAFSKKEKNIEIAKKFSKTLKKIKQRM